MHQISFIMCNLISKNKHGKKINWCEWLKTSSSLAVEIILEHKTTSTMNKIINAEPLEWNKNFHLSHFFCVNIAPSERGRAQNECTFFLYSFESQHHITSHGHKRLHLRMAVCLMLIATGVNIQMNLRKRVQDWNMDCKLPHVRSKDESPVCWHITAFALSQQQFEKKNGNRFWCGRFRTFLLYVSIYRFLALSIFVVNNCKIS